MSGPVVLGCEKGKEVSGGHVNVYLKSIGPYLQVSNTLATHEQHISNTFVYLKSVGPYLQGDDKFNYNYGISQAACGHWRGAGTNC